MSVNNSLSTACIKQLLNFNRKTSLIERSKKTLWSIKCRHRNLTSVKDYVAPRQAFRRYGKIIRRPLQGLNRRFFSKSKPRRVFDFLDRDKDSRLSYLEFRAWILLIHRSIEEHEVLQIFNEIDRNGDGAIEYKEFRDYFGVDVFSEEPSAVDLRLLFDELDLQQTGELSLEKLLAFFNRQNRLISREEGELFLGIASKTDNQSGISYPEFLRIMCEWKI